MATMSEAQPERAAARARHPRIARIERYASAANTSISSMIKRGGSTDVAKTRSIDLTAPSGSVGSRR